MPAPLIAALVDELLAVLEREPDLRQQLRDVLGLGEVEAGPLVYTTATLAEELGVTEETIRRRIRNEELRAELRGGSYVITRDAVREWAEPKPATPRSRSTPPRRRRSTSRPFRAALDAATRAE